MTKSLIIDPGHGGSDPGANGFGVKEKDWTLKISLYQYNRLKELGANVAITRTSDKTLDSVPRTDLIKGKYDYCMSNHFNAFNGKARGVETIHSIYSNGKVANKIANTIVETSGLPLRRVFDRKGKSGDYYFMHRLTGSTGTTIAEYGFIDNKTDHDFYKKESNFYKVAEAVVELWCGILGVAYVAPDGKPKSKPAPKQKVESVSTSKKAKKANGPVADIQSTVNSRYGYKISVDNIPGPETFKALLKAYQTELNKQFNAGLKVDGIWGPKTAAASVTVRRGAKGNLTWILQAMLYCKGHKIKVDGIFGGKTENAVKAFQRSVGIAVDGVPGAVTFAKLFE